MLGMLKGANLALAFGLELWLLGALAVFSFKAGPGGLWSWALAVLVVVVAAVLWPAFAAPRAAMRLDMPALALFKIALFALGAAALWFNGEQRWAAAFGAIVALNLALAWLWNQE